MLYFNGLLLVWRYFAHYLDRDIAKTYIDVVKIENRLGVPRELTLFNNFIESLTEEMGKNENKKVELFEKNIKKIDDVERIKFLKGLYKKSKMGYRGHKNMGLGSDILYFYFFNWFAIL
jgi:hypothetical protein